MRPGWTIKPSHQQEESPDDHKVEEQVFKEFIAWAAVGAASTASTAFTIIPIRRAPTMQITRRAAPEMTTAETISKARWIKWVDLAPQN